MNQMIGRTLQAGHDGTSLNDSPCRCLLTLLMLLTVSSAGLAQWAQISTANNALCVAPGDQIIAQAAIDGTGGVICTWADSRDGSPVVGDVYAQRIDGSGVVQWTTDGVGIATGTKSQFLPVIASDGDGGAIIAWNQNPDVYAQRVDADGIVQWQTNGIPVLEGVTGQPNPQIVSDESGGAIIVWEDRRNGNLDLYAQRVNKFGTVQWVMNGVAICTATGDQSRPQILGDGVGGAIIAWEDKRGTDTTDIYAQRIDSTGAVQWTPNGVVVCYEQNVQSRVRLARDGSGGAILVWEDSRNALTFRDIYAQRIGSTGAAMWAVNGVPVRADTVDEYTPDIVRDDSRGAFITWSDSRSHIQAQRINTGGALQWGTTGVIVSTILNSSTPALVRDGEGGAVIAWKDVTHALETEFHAQRIDSTGVLLWDPNGVAICSALGIRQDQVIVRDNAGGAILVWTDERSGGRDIYGQKIDSSGTLGNASPAISSVADVPGDQGGKLRVTWGSSNRDQLSNPLIQSYVIYRGVRSEISRPLDSIAYSVVGSIAASQLPSYSVLISTASDLDSSWTPWNFVKIRARISPSDYWESEVDSAYSVDNLAPAPPSNARLIIMGADTVRLRWDPDVADTDFAEYRIYRSANDGFLLDDSTYFLSTPDTSVFDAPPVPGSTYYRITARDVHGNESQPTPQLSFIVTGVQGGEVPKQYALHQNYPNPFNPTTVVSYQLSAVSGVKLVVYDLLGRELAVLVNERQGPGAHSVKFDASGLASGVYVYRLSAEGRVESRKMVLVR